MTGQQITARPPEFDPDEFTKPTLENTDGETGLYVLDDWKEHNEHVGITGLFIPDLNKMIVDNRNQTHHNAQFHYLCRSYGQQSPILAWTACFAEKNGKKVAYLELPSSHGGLMQAIGKRDLHDEVNAITQGHELEPSSLYPIVYACRVLGMPEETRVTFDHQHDQSVDPFYTQTRRFALKYAYMEMEMKDELPTDFLDRDVSVEYID